MRKKSSGFAAFARGAGYPPQWSQEEQPVRQGHEIAPGIAGSMGQHMVPAYQIVWAVTEIFGGMNGGASQANRTAAGGLVRPR
ncbi:MAG: hypothetical protein JXA21_28360 [Anaerolineae bacterium]|nr:hypothetical protein [Anaerolineae bacterium]